MQTICPWCHKNIDLKFLKIETDNTFTADCEYCDQEINFDPVDLLTYNQKTTVYFEVEQDFDIQDIACRLIEAYNFSEEKAKDIAPSIVEIFREILGCHESYFDCYWQSVNDAIDEYLSKNKIPDICTE